VRFLALRNEEPPDETVVVVRGGEMASDYVRRTARDAFDETGVYSLSVYLTLDEPLAEMCRGEPFLARYGKVRLSTVARVRQAGFVLLPTLGRPHCDIVLPDTSDGTLVRLDVCFDPPVSNPGRRLEP
jgi:hypothetical protein